MNVDFSIVSFLFLRLLSCKVYYCCLFRPHSSLPLFFCPSAMQVWMNALYDVINELMKWKSVCTSLCFISEILQRVKVNVDIGVQTKVCRTNLFLVCTYRL
jgi:hypothetical protein